MSKIPLQTLNALVIASAAGAAALAVTQTVNVSHVPQERERCYGVVKAGKNDCGTGAHSCAAQSMVDGDAESWVSVPKGLCLKLTGGKLQGGGS